MDQIEQFIRDSGWIFRPIRYAFTTATAPMRYWTAIISGKKHANTGLYSLFQAQMQLLPKTGDHTVVLDSQMQPRCITRTVKVEILPFAEVTQDCALAEGDGTLAQWREVHRKAFETACAEIGHHL